MSLRNRLTKLERRVKPEKMPLLMIPSADNHWTPVQLQQMKESAAQGRMIIKINYVEARKHANS